MELLALICLLSLLCGVVSLKPGQFCPNRCSGHGECNLNWRVCDCQEAWNYAADCSLRSCPFDLSWADKPQEMDKAHVPSECSDNGLCNRRTGQCQCFPGYGGEACQKSLCPNDCSGHGVCNTMAEVYDFYTQNKSAYPYYTSWEANHTTMCVCDNGYTGAACDISVCPRGIDPMRLLVDKEYPSLYLSTYAVNVNTGFTGGSFRISFQEKSFYLEANTSYTADDCKHKFESLPNVGTVSCEVIQHGDDQDGGASYNVTFLSAPLTVYENNIYSNNGTYFIKSFDCNTSNVIATTAECQLIDTTNYKRSLPRYEYCSGRGVCNLNTGVCSCYRDFTNVNCGTYMPVEAVAQGPLFHVLDAQVEYPNYNNSNVMTLGAMYTGTAPGFEYLNVSAQDNVLTLLDGNGNLDMRFGSLKLNGLEGTGGQTIALGGLVVESGGFTVNNAGFTVTGGMTVSGDSRRYDTLTIDAGGFGITSGGMTVSDSGIITSSGGITVNSKGLFVSDSSGLKVSAGGGTVVAGGMLFPDGFRIGGGGLNSKKGVTLNDHGLTVTGGLTINSVWKGSGYATSVTGMTVNSDGMTVKGGMSVYTNGVIVKQGTVQVPVNNMVVTGGLTIFSAGLQATGGVTLQDAGLVVSGGMTIASGGLKVPTAGLIAANGMTVRNGLVVSGGMTLQDLGMTITGGVSVYSAGVAVAGGMTINNLGWITDGNVNLQSGLTTATVGSMTVQGTAGMKVTGGATVTASGALISAGGVTIARSGLFVSGGMSILSAGTIASPSPTQLGLLVSQGTTIKSGGLYSSSAITLVGSTGARLNPGATSGIRISQSGLTTTGGMSVATGMVVSSGMSVNNGGIHVTGGATISNGLVVDFGGMSLTTSGMKVKAGDMNLIGHSSLAVATGGTVANSGIMCSGGVTLNDVGLVVTGGVTTYDLPVRVTAGGVSVGGSGMRVSLFNTFPMKDNDGLHVDAGGVSLMSWGTRVNNGGVTVAYDGMKVANGGIVVHNGLSAAGGLTTTTFGLMVTDGVTVVADGLSVYGGATLSSGGLSLNNLGQVSIMKDGLFITSGGLTVQGSSLQVVSTGIKVPDSGLVVTDGFTVQSGGLYASAWTNADGLVVTGGMTVDKFYSEVATLVEGAVGAGLFVTGGVTLRDVGLGFISTGLLNVGQTGASTEMITVSSAGLAVTGGVTIKDTGLNIVSGGLTVYAPITRGLVIDSGELDITGGLTIQQTGMTVYSGGVYIESPSPAAVISGIIFLNNADYYSDRRLKTDFEPLQKPLDTVKKLRGVYFNWIDPTDLENGDTNSSDSSASSSSSSSSSSTQDTTSKSKKGQSNIAPGGPKFDSRRHLGMLAQDVLQVFPEAVTAMKGGGGVTDDGTYLGVNYKDMIPLLVEAIRELDLTTANMLAQVKSW